MTQFISFNNLTENQLAQYRQVVAEAFPAIIQNSEIVKNDWEKVERYFPSYQRILLDEAQSIIGLICTLPFHWTKPLSELPMDGWDWLMGQGISDFESKIAPNYLGGLQIVINKNHKGKGHSKMFIAEGKRIMQSHGFENFVLPIRPTMKSQFPEMPMIDYISYKENDKIFDPWIRTHMNSGAKVINVCNNAMNVKGDISFWESLVGAKIKKSGSYKVEGALNLVSVDIESNLGEYREDNIWIYYSYLSLD